MLNYVRSPVTFTSTLDQVEVTRVHISGRGLPTHQIRSNQNWKNFLWIEVPTGRWMDGHDFQ